jgi:hypothetical protein
MSKATETDKPTKPTTTSSAAAMPSKTRPGPAIVDRWFRERIHGSPLARSTEHYNFLHEAVRDLKHRLTEE